MGSMSVEFQEREGTLPYKDTLGDNGRSRKMSTTISLLLMSNLNLTSTKDVSLPPAHELDLRPYHVTFDQSDCLKSVH